MSNINAIAAQHGFTLKSSESLPEIEGNAYVMTHEASRAQLLFLQNDDPNKAFSISFKTPAADDTGVFHILEHSVLCGSDKFPVKEPFVNLLKTSMQTFLNAMTFPDKTMYPVASTNERDLLNLMDVYLDAVFHPAIYSKPTIFEQEGWHYELAEETPTLSDDADACAEDAVCETPESAEPAKLMLNGVVYNEMKGALSDPDSVLYDALSAALFPDTTYRFESGGTPKAIPSLTYESYLDTHKRHYRTDNSYITLYGNMDLDVFLAFLDERYLTPLAAQLDEPLNINPLEMQDPVVALEVKHPMVTAPENAAAAVGYVLGTARDRDRMIAADILLDAIMGSNEAPMKRALLDANLAADAAAFIADAVLQPFAVVQLRGLEEGGADRFRAVVEEQARILAEGGLDHELLEAALSHAEFVMRERNFGYADGVILSMSSLAGWLYDDDMPTAYLRFEETFAKLRAQIDTGFFEQLLKEIFLENDHRAEVELVTVEKLEDYDEQAELAAAAANMTDDDFARIEAQVAVLREAQEAPDAPEDLAKLPQLSVADLDEAPEEPAYFLDETTPIPCLRHTVGTRGIAYAYRYFDLNCLTFEELPYVTVLAMVLGKLDTAQHTAAQIDTLGQSKLGNMAFLVEVHEDPDVRENLSPKFIVSSSALAENVTWIATLPNEILLTTNFGDHGKIRDILTQKRVSIEQSFANAGHGAAMSRVASYYLPSGVLREQMRGVDFYRFLVDLTDHFDERIEDLESKLRDISARLFADDNCLLSFTGSDEELASVWEAGLELGIRNACNEDALVIPEPEPKNEAFIIPSDVSYTSMGFDRRLLGIEHKGAWLLAQRILTYDFLWNEVRVKGGAYGTGFQATRSGNLRFYSYRDPHIDPTVKRFHEAGAWLSAFNPDEAEMGGYIVSTTAGIDSPMKPRELVRRQDGQFLGGIDPASRLKTRQQVIDATPEDVRALGATISSAADQHFVCVFGGKAIIERSGEQLTVINLLNA